MIGAVAMEWIRNRYDDFVFWWVDRPFSKLWKAVVSRIDAFFFCLLLMVVGIYSPRSLRNMIIDSIKDKK
jgi:hypothetical protein